MSREKTTYFDDLARIILADLSGELNDSDRAVLDSWLRGSPERQAMLESLRDEEHTSQEVARILARDTVRGWAAVTARMEAQAARRKRTRTLAWRSAAASVLLLAGVFGLYLLSGNDDEIAALAGTYAIDEGRRTATLISASGDVFSMDTVTSIQLPFSQATNLGNEIVFVDQSGAGATEEGAYNRLTVPRGAEYKITLGDGTVVHLNAETELLFPDNLSELAERVVTLSGEAYFDVAHNDGQPFVVRCGDVSLRVLGTSFNVSAYPDEPDYRATLASGSIEVLCDDHRQVLAPGQQAVVRDGELRVEEVDVELYTTWMHEGFRFKNGTMEEIMRRLCRWYPVDVEFAEEALKEWRFSGYIPRYADIGNVLELLTLTSNIRFEIRGDTVLISRK